MSELLFMFAGIIMGMLSVGVTGHILILAKLDNILRQQDSLEEMAEKAIRIELYGNVTKDLRAIASDMESLDTLHKAMIKIHKLIQKLNVEGTPQSVMDTYKKHK